MRSIAIALTVFLASSVASAITQPDGTIIPQTPALMNLFSSRGETINALSDAAITPERFVPGCRLTFTLVTRGMALFQNAFGWYNVTGARPLASDLHALIPCGAPDGTVATLDLRMEPAYRGGEIAFFLQTPESRTSLSSCAGGDCCARVGHDGYTYFTERAFNPDNMGPSSYTHLLIYDSRVTPQSFYFAWEDLYGGGDNQFTDFVAQVGNIVCSGAGGACNTGRPGACAAGTQQCRAGMLQCMGLTNPSPERCDGADNDCNGMTDDGMGLCPTGQICERGSCVPRCVEGGCFESQVCTARGACVETACETVTCPEGQRCEAGMCRGACDGVTCPGTQVCRAGRCVEPCAGVTCDMDQVCVTGICQPRCECRRCAAGQTCGSDGRCVTAACATVMCTAGSVCVAGACIDACTGATCPRGEMCSMGTCVATPVIDGGTTADAAYDSGFNFPEAGGNGRMDSGRRDANTDARSNDSGLSNGMGTCGCRTVGDTHRRPGALIAGALALCALASRRRGRRAN